MTQEIIRHGEVLLVPVIELPKTAKLVKTVKSHIVAHSETGHHHVLELPTKVLRVYEVDNESYLDVGDVGQLLHEKTGVDAHKTHVVAPGKYKVVIKQAFDYFKGLLQKVRD